MATVTTQDTPQNNGRPTAAPRPMVAIRNSAFAFVNDDAADRMWHRQVPAWVISGAIHMLLMAAFLIYNYFSPALQATAPENQIVETKLDDAQKEQQNFENTEVGLDPTKQTNYNNDRIEDVSVPGIVRPDEPVGIVGAPEGPPQTIPPPPGFGGGQGGGIVSPDAGTGAMIGDAGGWLKGRSLPGVAFAGRSGSTRQKMLAEGGGNGASEAAVAKGLKYLQRMQKSGGNWVLDGANRDDVAATGLALLPFLAAGQTHKPMKGEKESSYARTVQLGLDYLRSKQKANGAFGCPQLYGEAIATLAMCEAFGMTQDPALRKPAQMAIDFLVKSQHSVGGYRYKPLEAGDTSVTGWCLQALQSGYLAGLSVPRETLYKVGSYLDSVQTQSGAAYGYVGPGATASMTAVGLLCREYLGWGPKNPNLANGVENLKKNGPSKTQGNTYYYYYATQVVHFFGGDDWVTWNLGGKGPDGVRKQGMRDILIDTQDSSNSPNQGSWAPGNDQTSRGGGRLCNTCLSLLTLEVYYRHLPMYRNDAGGLKDVD
jgi:hypothetical protein